MKLEHEIPTNSKLYFGKMAHKKREFENLASKILQNNNFEEIITPLFSYHQRENMNEKELIALRDEDNYPMYIRADSTVDVVKILLKKINVDNKKWFYIQPIYKFPSSEFYQIGVEILENGDINELLQLAIKILNNSKIDLILQLSNIKIPNLISQHLGISIDIFKQIEIEKLLSFNIDWLTKLVFVENLEGIQNLISTVPNYLKSELDSILKLGKTVQHTQINLKVAPLFYSQMEYYDNLFFRIFSGNRLISRGGLYTIEKNLNSAGFSIYTDEVLKIDEKH